VSYSPTDDVATVEVTMPQMGVSVAEGTILKWLKREGEEIAADEVICEISTDKIDTEVPSPAAGRVARILVEENETVPVGTVIAELEPAGRPSGPSAPVSASPSANGHAEKANGTEPDRSHVISPVVRRVADEHGIDLSQIEGTGVGGRIRKKDVLAHLESKPQPTLHSESPYRPEPEPNGHHDGERREVLSPMRRQIAEHMVRSRKTAAHCTTVIEVDMNHVTVSRAELKPAYEARGVPLTVLAYVARATVTALREEPVLNASLDGDALVHHDDVNLGIAVALEDGLIVPVIHRAQHLNLEGLAAAIGDLSARARSKRLTAEDVQGGTFTITNPGRFGTVLATPIINQPQVAILDLEAVVKRPVVVEGPEGDAVAVRPMANLCLSFDHRALDGAEAARFLGRMKALLERPQAAAS
jgi:2-oxoglutarate dehydrogenase complex dihydrolipoamide succinyltransferase (E2) component